MFAFAKYLPEGFRWSLYSLVGKISALKDRANSNSRNVPNRVAPAPVKSEGDQSYVWVFCSTIGELNACKPLISQLQSNRNLILLTDRSGYEEAFLKHFPGAVVILLLEGALPDRGIIEQYPPQELYLAEIPLIPADAPCRLSYSLLRNLKKYGASVYVVNGWLYGYQPNCRQDAIEREWFTTDYLDCFDHICVQTNEVRDRLTALGAAEDRVHVTGNMKFDALDDIGIALDDEVNKSLLRQFCEAEGKIVVAGCLSDAWEYRLLLDAFTELHEVAHHSKLILAPRHPESAAQIKILRNLGEESILKVVFKSELDSSSSLDFDVMILDSIGELKSYYSISSIAYVGRNHNVLEPLSFGKPVLVLSGWEEEFPSYPVYKVTSEKGLLIETEIEKFAATLVHAFDTGALLDKESIQKSLEELSGATHRNVELIGKQQYGTRTSGG
jgi:3-deoxy-D-manno-octulosonic-acid transferase